MTAEPHAHRTFVDGCFRCDLSRHQTADDPRVFEARRHVIDPWTRELAEGRGVDLEVVAGMLAAYDGLVARQECPHGGCCESFGYVIGFVEHLLATLPKDSAEWDTAARIMDEVGK